MRRRALLATLILLAIAATAFPGTETIPTAASDGATIRVVNHGSSIRFGERIDVTMEASSAGSPIEKIRAVYRPRGPRTIARYSYPDFNPASSVTARFTIPTAEPTFIPPGIVFEVRYEITDSDGRQFESKPFEIEYLDPEFDWKRATRAGLTVLYHDRSGREITELLEAVAARLPEMEAVTGAAPGGEYRAVLYNSNAEARRAFPTVSKAASDGHLFAGFAYEEFGMFVLDHAKVPGVTHELAHLVFGRATSYPAAKRPAWLNEGLAVYFETGSRAASRSRIGDAIRRDRLLPLRSINSIPGRPDQIQIFYPQAGDFAGYLVEVRGAERVRGLIAALDRGALPAAAVQAVYGISLDELENEWRKDIGARPIELLPAPSAHAGSTAVAGGVAPVATGALAPETLPNGSSGGSFRIWWGAAGSAVLMLAATATILLVYRIRRSG